MTPFGLWTQLLLKGGDNVLETMQAVVRSARQTSVGVIPTADAPQPATHSKPVARRRAKPKAKARTKAAPKRPARARSAKARARRR
jgi:hypothetical protein